jgi:hypothetical protein
MDADDANVRFLADLMGRFDLDWALLRDRGRETIGRTRAELVEAARRSLFVLNVMGFLDDDEILAAAPLRVFLDIDPGFPQMWTELGLADPFAGHDRFVTVGLRVGTDGCEIPTCGLDWIPTPPPVELDEWPVASANGRRFTSVASWRGAFGPIDYRGRTYGLRVHEFRRFFELPERTNADFELALDIHEAETPDLEALDRHGWRLVDPRAAAGDVGRYREYVQGSLAELMVAKNMYVASRSGWFSDRSICYLASGRPVLAQDTGFSNYHPVGRGLLAFTTLAEAIEGVERIVSDYPAQSRAARELAEEHFDSNRVLRGLLEKLGIA